MLPTIITRMVGWAVAVFYRVERTGPGLVSGPVLVAANHPNSLIDPLLIFYTGGRRTRPLAKAPLFDHIVVGIALRGLGGIPVYRRQDDPHQMHRNTTTFDAAIAALVRGEAVQIYPEGRSHSEPSMSELRTGAARIALMAEEQAGWTLGLKVQPVGLTYEQKLFFRGRAVAAYGEPIEVAAYRGEYERNQRDAARALTDDIRRGLLEVTLQAETTEEVVRAFAEEEGLKLGKVAQPLRAALTGRAVSPGVFDVMQTLGRKETLARLADATGS